MRHTILESPKRKHAFQEIVSVVLVHLTDNRCTPFVTWFNCHPDDYPSYTVDGHYFDNLHDALEDYTNRVERNEVGFTDS